MKLKHIVRILSRVFLGILCAALICIYLLYRIDAMTLWSVLPGVGSSKEMREAGYSMVTIIERLPEEEKARNMAASITLFGAVAYAEKTAEGGEIGDQIMSQYVLGLVRGGLLEAEGKLSSLEYQLLKLPFKTGNTKIMKRMLPVLQRKTSLPDGFMSAEYVGGEKKQE